MKQRKNLSALLFAALTVVQMFLVRYMMNNAPITGVPITVLVEIAAVFLFGGAAIWLFAARSPFFATGKKVVCGAALFYLLFIAVYYDVELSLIMSGLSLFGEQYVQNLTWSYGALTVKILLLVAAVWCMALPAKRPGEPSELQEAVQEAAQAMRMDSETMKQDVNKAVSEFENAMGSDEEDK